MASDPSNVMQAVSTRVFQRAPLSRVRAPWWRQFSERRKIDARDALLAKSDDHAASRDTDAVGAPHITHRVKVGLLWFVLCALALITMIAAIGIGAYQIPATSVIDILLGTALSPFGIALGMPIDPQQSAVLWTIRVPRVLLGVAVGAGLAISGALLQGLFRNPLADPGLIGVTMGAALAAAFVIVMGGALVPNVAQLLGGALLPIASVLGGAVVVLVVYRIATKDGATSISAMLLAGIAITAFASAGIGIMIYLASDAQNRELSFWTLGSLARSNWGVLAIVLPCVVLSLIAARLLAPQLNALALGETEASYLGVNTQRVKHLVLLVALITVGASVAFCGPIGFIGLVAPHCVRLLAGPDHRTLIPAAALLGAILTVCADLMARTMVAPAELPIGILTSLLGVPFFLILLRRNGHQWSAS
jgi:iron complex transport system permease protein